MPNKILLTVSEAAEKLNVSADTIRRWAKKGLIKSARSENNYRLFDLKELERINGKINGTNTENRYQILKSKIVSEYTSIELFAGGGGTALGLENAGFKHILLNEFNKDCVATLKQNRPNWNVVHDSVSNLRFDEFFGKVDLVQGGFPCQAFSYAVKRQGF